jgi:hypothetical protein
MARTTAQSTETRAFWGRVGGLRAHALHGPDVMLSAARKGFRDRFTRLVDPDGLLDPIEREVRASRLRRAWMLELAARSASVRRSGGHRSTRGRARSADDETRAADPAARRQ